MLIKAFLKAGVFARMEHPGSSLSAPPRVLCFSTSYVTQHGNVDHISRQRVRPRTCDELYYEEAEGLWIFGTDAAVTDCSSAENQVCEGENTVQRELLFFNGSNKPRLT